MNILPTEKRAQILQMLCEGMSIRAITRITGVSKNTVAKLLVDAGTAFAEYQDKAFRNLSCRRIQVDEVWSFVFCKEKNVAEGHEDERGDCWTWVAFDADTKLMPSWYIGNRDADSANAFMADLSSRLANRVQLTSDGYKVYLEAVEQAFGSDIDYSMLVKIYGNSVEGEKRYSPAKYVESHKRTITGKPDVAHASTSYVERQNLTLRMHMRRFTRLTNAFSKKLENHAHAFALNAMYYNFVRIHGSLRVTPAMEAGVTKRLWEMADLVKLVESREVPKKRGSYKKASN